MYSSVIPSSKNFMRKIRGWNYVTCYQTVSFRIVKYRADPLLAWTCITTCKNLHMRKTLCIRWPCSREFILCINKVIYSTCKHVRVWTFHILKTFKKCWKKESCETCLKKLGNNATWQKLIQHAINVALRNMKNILHAWRYAHHDVIVTYHHDVFLISSWRHC